MSIEDRVAALEREMQRLIDIEEIKCLKGKYFRCLDSKDWEGLSSTLSPTVKTSYSNGKLVFNGPKEVTDYFAKVMPKTDITLHQGHTPEIWFESDTVAYAHWYLQDNLIWVEPDPHAGNQCQGSAIYTDKYEKVEGKWLISEIGYVRVYEEFFKRDNTHMITANMHMHMKKPGKKTAKKKD